MTGREPIRSENRQSLNITETLTNLEAECEEAVVTEATEETEVTEEIEEIEETEVKEETGQQEMEEYVKEEGKVQENIILTSTNKPRLREKIPLRLMKEITKSHRSEEALKSAEITTVAATNPINQIFKIGINANLMKGKKECRDPTSI